MKKVLLFQLYKWRNRGLEISNLLSYIELSKLPNGIQIVTLKIIT